MIYLVEHFYSIQGEGRYIGRPSVFFRLGGCNLTCKGFNCTETSPSGEKIIGCDTVYAVDRSFTSTWVALNNAQELINILKHYDLPFAVDIVFTGGEPLLHVNDPILIEFLHYLHVNNHRITFETNATIKPDFTQYPIYSKCIYALSVKLQNSLEPYTKRVKPDVLASIAYNAKEAFFKFSIDKNSINASLDEEIEEIIQNAPHLEVYCMPVGANKTSVEENAPMLIEYCKEKGYIYSDRLHIRIWDDNKGV